MKHALKIKILPSSTKTMEPFDHSTASLKPWISEMHLF